VTRALEQFWLPEEGHISAMLDPEAHSRSGLDAAVLLAVLRVGPPATAGRPFSWSVADDRVLATVERYVESFAGGLYAINNATGSHSKRYWHGAIAVGRYAEDVYDGDGKSAANPWFITTFAVSEILHRFVLFVPHLIGLDPLCPDKLF
jgi:glucoamylase